MQKSRLNRSFRKILILTLALAFLPIVVAYATVVGTKHDLSAGGEQIIRATTVTEICVFCHTPHSATTVYPLWNHSLSSATYSIYTSPTLLSWGTPSSPQQPDGGSRLCLGCHDGTVGIGLVLNTPGRGTIYPTQIALEPSERLDAEQRLVPGTLTNPTGYIGTYILGGTYHMDHPVSIAVNDLLIADKYDQCSTEGVTTHAYQYPATATYPGVKLRWTGHTYKGQPGQNNSGVQCRTCHDPHQWSSVNGGSFLTHSSLTICNACHCTAESGVPCSCP